MRLCPIALKIQGRRCVVVGGGAVAQRKVGLLVECGADVAVVSVAFTPTLEARAARGEVTLVAESFRPSHLAGATLAIAATDDRAVNESVLSAGKERGVLVNVVDVPELCDFFMPALVCRGRLEIAVSTGGACPALAKKLRKELAEQFGPEYDAYIDMAARLREALKAQVPDPATRKSAIEAFLDSQALEYLRQGRSETAENLARQYLSEATGEAHSRQ